jgi:hypothetical protein
MKDMTKKQQAGGGLNMLTIRAIEDRGMGLVAVFDDSLEGRFALNEENLKTRITNLNSIGLDTSVENAALAEMVRRRTIAKPKEGYAV